jgi:hypothetical protein
MARRQCGPACQCHSRQLLPAVTVTASGGQPEFPSHKDEQLTASDSLGEAES